MSQIEKVQQGPELHHCELAEHKVKRQASRRKMSCYPKGQNQNA